MCVQLPWADLSLGLGWKELSLVTWGCRCAILALPKICPSPHHPQRW